MMNILEWIETLIGSNMPGLSWLKYVIVGVFILVIFDAVLTLIFRALDGLSGNRR